MAGTPQGPVRKVDRHLVPLETAKALWPSAPPSRCLVIGQDLDDTLDRLQTAGIHARGLGADAFLREDPHDPEAPWPALLLHESAHGMDAIDLFDRASRLLAPHGELIVVDTFVLRRSQPEMEPLHFIEYFVRLAERFGFAVASQVDRTEPAQPARDRPDGFTDGRWGRRLLKLTRQAPPRWRLGRIAGARDEEMRALFAEVFGHAMSAAHWHWKYGDGRGQGIGAWQAPESSATDGATPARLVAHYGGTTREIRYFGQAARAFQACDLMVAQSARRALTRQGPVFLVAATFLEQNLGFGARHLLGIGFPNERAYRAPAHLGLYCDVLAHIHEVRWPALHTRPSLRQTLREAHPDDPGLDARLDACWALMQASLDDFIVGVRDARYLRHRYFAHPDHHYRVIVVQRRLSARVEGLVVLRRIDERCELLDAVGALHSMPVLVHHARRVAAQWGCTQLFAWLAKHLLAHFALPLDAQVQDLGVLVPGNAWTAGPPIESLKDRWWLTGGDTDFH